MFWFDFVIMLSFHITTDIDECMLRKKDSKYRELYPWKGGVCQNTRPHYKCICQEGTRSDGTNFGCIADQHSLSNKNNNSIKLILRIIGKHSIYN